MKIYPRTLIGKYLTIKEGIPVTVTDPGYDKETWCTKEINMKPGEYFCTYWRGRCDMTINGKRHYDSRIFMNGIFRKEDFPFGHPANKYAEGEEIGTIGVDAGMAGFFQNKPDYEEEEWFAFCNKHNKKHYILLDYGFSTSSGYGDGTYPVKVWKNASGEIVGAAIEF